MDPLVFCLAQKGSRYFDNNILEIRLSKNYYFCKDVYVRLTFLKIVNEDVIFERLNSCDGVRPN